MYFKVHKSYRNVIAICDSELLGKRFEYGRFQLDVKESFYKGEKAGENEIIELLERMSREDATFSIVGNKSVNAAIKAGIINEDEVGEIQSIKFALILL